MAIENERFEIYLRLNSNIRIVYFSRRLFAMHYTLSSWCRIFSKIILLSISKFFVYCCHSDIDFT